MSELNKAINSIFNQLFSTMDIAEAIEKERDEEMLTAAEARREYGFSQHETAKLKERVPYFQSEIDRGQRFQRKHLKAYIKSKTKNPCLNSFQAT